MTTLARPSSSPFSVAVRVGDLAYASGERLVEEALAFAADLMVFLREGVARVQTRRSL